VKRIARAHADPRRRGLRAAARARRNAPIAGVGAIGITVSDLDRAVAFYTEVLGFEQRAQSGGVGTRARAARGRIRDARARGGPLARRETIELTEYLAPRGRAMPADSRANDRWFQHVAIVTSDLDRAYAQLRERGVEHASTGPQRLPELEPERGRDRGVLLPRPRRTLSSS
jgi:catechol 2,3-dioxygenase-like lactoylglutathione lyase family enzyme